MNNITFYTDTSFKGYVIKQLLNTVVSDTLEGDTLSNKEIEKPLFLDSDSLINLTEDGLHNLSYDNSILYTSRYNLKKKFQHQNAVSMVTDSYNNNLSDLLEIFEDPDLLQKHVLNIIGFPEYEISNTAKQVISLILEKYADFKVWKNASNNNLYESYIAYGTSLLSDIDIYGRVAVYQTNYYKAYLDINGDYEEEVLASVNATKQVIRHQVNDALKGVQEFKSTQFGCIVLLYGSQPCLNWIMDKYKSRYVNVLLLNVEVGLEKSTLRLRASDKDFDVPDILSKLSGLPKNKFAYSINKPVGFSYLNAQDNILKTITTLINDKLV